jgi:O-antigen ligase
VKKIDLAGFFVFLCINSYFTGSQEDIAISSIPLWLLAITLSYFVYSNAKNPSKPLLMSGLGVLALSTLLVSITVSSLISESPMTERILGSAQRGDGLANYVSLIFIFVGIIQLDLKSKVRLIDWVILSGIFQASVGFAQIFGLEIFNKIGYAGVTGTLRNTNTAGFFLALLATISFSRALDKSIEKKIRLVYLFLYAIFAVQAILTKTIQGPVLTLAGTLGLASMLLYANLKGRNLKVGAKIFPWAIIVTSFFAVFFVYPHLLKIETFKIRTLYWRAAWEMFLENPIFGVGPGSFGSFVSEHRSVDYVKTLGPNLRVDDAHNVFLHLLSTVGCISTFLIVFSIFVILVVVVRKSRNTLQDSSLVIVLVFILGSSISYFNPTLILVFLVFLAVLHSPIESVKRNKLTRISFLSVTTTFVALIVFSFVIIGQTNIPNSLTQSEAKAFLLNTSLRCENRTELLTKVINGGVQLSEQEIESVYLSDVRCLEIGIAIARRDTLENRLTATPAINRVLQIDPNNPVIIGLQALVADKSNDSINARKLIEQANSMSDLSTLGDEELSKQFLDLLAKQP